jgi:hypothetical protein
VWVLAAALLLSFSEPAFAYLKFGFRVNGRVVTIKWETPAVQYFISDRGGAGIAAGAFRDAVGRAFAAWEAVPTSSIAYQFGGFTAAMPGQDDGRTVIGFIAAPELERVLASTSLLIDELTGELLEADIFFNSAFSWSTTAGGESGRFDIETIAVHEIGHLNGLGHSGLGETEISGTGRRVLAAASTMFPLAFGPGSQPHRTLQADDIAGISDLYPQENFEDTSGSISGRVTRNGSGLFGAHVVAFNPESGSLVGNFSLSENGEFSIAGLAPGPYVLRVEPIDDADADSFFDLDEPLDINFRSRFHDKLVIAPRGGDSGAIEIKVLPK